MFKAIIFDMNGVIINDERIHQESWRQYCQKHGFSLTEDEFKHQVFGRTEKEILEYLYKKEVTPEELEKDSNERVALSIQIFQPQLQIMEGLDTLLENLYQNNIPLAIATSSRNRYLDFILDGLSIRKYFKVIVTAQDITKGKPDPEIYLKTANQLNIDAKDCIVFEDTISGIKSAKAAGMKVIGVATTHSKEELESANSVIHSFTEVSLEMLNAL